MGFSYGIDTMDLAVIQRIASDPKVGDLTPAIGQIKESHDHVIKMSQGTQVVYGINTGFGPLCDTHIEAEKIIELQSNLLKSHAVGVGPSLSDDLVRFMLIMKLHALAQGKSGVSLDLLKRVQFFLEHDVLPIVPSQGSVGASGDLAPLSHLFLPFLGIGEVRYDGKIYASQKVHNLLNLQPLILGPKEGLALINGTQFITAHAVKGLIDMRYLLDLSDMAGAMSLEGLRGSAAPFRKELHELRPFDGCIHVATRMRALLKNSKNLAAHENCNRVQDPYSIRCIPQVHGASRNAYAHLLALTEIEMNAVTDNPIILSNTEAISGGNFHGQPLAMALDYCALAAAELGNISDRRSYLLLEGKYDLPRMLTNYEGVSSGYMIPQYTSAALVSENKSLCFPASSDSIPTSLGQEDHVSMGSISGRKYLQILDNLEKILAIELLLAAQALDFRRPERCSDIIEENHRLIRDKIPTLEEDRYIAPDIKTITDMVHHRLLLVDL